jgi:hypothetical protein
MADHEPKASLSLRHDRTPYSSKHNEATGAR